MTTERKLIEKQKEREDLLQNFRRFFNKRYNETPEAWKIEILYVDIRDFITSLESELAKEEPEGVTAEEILKNKLSPDIYFGLKNIFHYHIILEVIEYYAKSKQINLRDELIKFYKWYYSKNPFSVAYKSRIKIIDEYLNQKDE